MTKILQEPWPLYVPCDYVVTDRSALIAVLRLYVSSQRT